MLLLVVVITVILFPFGLTGTRSTVFIIKLVIADILTWFLILGGNTQFVRLGMTVAVGFPRKHFIKLRMVPSVPAWLRL